MNAATNVRISDPQLVYAFMTGIDAGTPVDASSLCKILGRTRADNVKRSLARAEKAGTLTIDPPSIADEVRAVLIADPPDMPEPADATAGTSAETRLVPIEKLHASPFNPRKRFDEDLIDELADSILAQGLLQSPLGRPHPKKPGEIQIGAGERRRRALAKLKAAGRKSAAFDPAEPVEIKIKDLTDEEMIMVGIAENAERTNPSVLEEANAYRELKKLFVKNGGKEHKASTHIASLIGKNGKSGQRFVQKRLDLVEKLIEQGQKMLDEGKIPAEHARALASVPEPVQVEIIHQIQKGNGSHYRTADDIRAAMKQQSFPASKAKFKREDYIDAVTRGKRPIAIEDAIWTETDSEAEFYTVRPIVERLQSAAVDALVAKHKKKGATFVHVTDWRAHYDYPDLEDGDPDELGGVLIVYDPQDLTVTLHRRVKINDREAKKQAAAEEKAAADKAEAEKRKAAAEEAGVRLVPQRYSRRVWLNAKRRKTDALQAAVAQGSARIAGALIVIGLCESGAIGGPQMADKETIRIHTTHRTGSDRDIGLGSYLATALAPLAEEFPGAFHIHERDVLVTDAAKALKALLSTDQLERILAACVADRVGTWTGLLCAGGDEGPGDSPLAIALAGELELDGAKLEADEREDYFNLFPMGTLAMIIKRAGADPGDFPDKRPEAAAELAQCEAGQNFHPIEFDFNPPEIVAGAMDALLQGLPAPKGGAK